MDLRAHLRGISIRLGHHLVARPKDPMGSHDVGPELWALREVGWRGAAATLLHDARGQLPVLPRAVVAQARAHLFGDARHSAIGMASC